MSLEVILEEQGPSLFVSAEEQESLEFGITNLPQRVIDDFEKHWYLNN